MNKLLLKEDFEDIKEVKKIIEDIKTEYKDVFKEYLRLDFWYVNKKKSDIKKLKGLSSAVVYLSEPKLKTQFENLFKLGHFKKQLYVE